MAALTHGTRSALVAPTSSRPSVPAAKLPLGAAAFRAGLSTRQPSRNERVQKIVRQGLMFDDDEEEEEDYIPEYPNPRFIAETLEAFPDAAVANAEQARVLFTEGGYTYLDVRPSIEYEDVGKVKGSVNIPIVNAVRKYDPEQKKKVTTKSPNEQWIQQVEKKLPKKDTKLLVGCSNGTQYSLDALGELDEAGYENIVGLKGGFYAWFSVWDNKLGRRRTGEYAETYMHDGDSCGIHSSGAGFDRVDKADKWVPPEY